MEDWQEMLIIILIVLLGMTAYLVYLGNQMVALRDSVSEYSDMKSFIDEARGAGEPGPVMSPFDFALNGPGR